MTSKKEQPQGCFFYWLWVVRERPIGGKRQVREQRFEIREEKTGGRYEGDAEDLYKGYI